MLSTIFTPENHGEVEDILKNECGENMISGDSKQWYALMKRIQFAVLKTSEGDVEKLRAAVHLARLDFRGALMEANFDSSGECKGWVQNMLDGK